MARVRYIGKLVQPVGRVLIPRDGSPWEVRIRGTATPVTFYTASTGGSSFTGTVANLHVNNGTVEPAGSPNGEVWIDSGVSYDEYTTADGAAVSGSNPLVKVSGDEAVSASQVAAVLSAPTPGSTDSADLRASIAQSEVVAGGRLLGRGDSLYNLISIDTRTYPSTGATTYPVALRLNSGQRLDGGGGVLRLKSGQDATLVTNDDTSNTDIALVGWVIDGQDIVITNRALVRFEGVVGLELDLRFRNLGAGGSGLPLYVIDCDEVIAPRGISSEDAGFSIGTASHPVRYSHFGPLRAKGAVQDLNNVFNFPGNALAIVMEDSVIDSLEARDSAASIKVYNSKNLKIPGGARCKNIGGVAATGSVTKNGTTTLTGVTTTFGQWVNGMTIYGTGIPAGTTIVSGAGTSTMVISQAATDSLTSTVNGDLGNTGLKVQGGSGTVSNVEIGPSSSKSCTGHGLFIGGGSDLSDVTIESYYGEDNASLAAWPDIWIDNANQTVKKAKSVRSGARGVLIRATATNYKFGNLDIVNPGQTTPSDALADFGGQGTIDKLTVLDDQGMQTTQRGVNVSTGAVMRIREADIRGPYTAPITVAAGAKFSCGPLRLHDTDPLADQLTLTAGVSTDLANKNIFAASNLRPIFALVPLNDAARAIPLPEASFPVASGTATFSGGSTSITSVTNTTQWKNGMVIRGRGIPNGTTIASGAGTSTMVLSNAVDAAGGGSGVVISGSGVATLTHRPAAGTEKYAYILGGLVTHTDMPSVPAVAPTPYGSPYGVMLSSGRYSGPYGASFNTAIMAQGVCSSRKLPVINGGTLDRLSIDVTVASEAGGLLRFGIYSDNGNGLPGALLLDAGTTAADATGERSVTISQPVTPGLYHVCVVAQSCPTTGPTVRTDTTGDPTLSDATFGNVSNPGSRNGFQKSSVTGALSGTWGTANTAGTCPRPVVRAA